MTKLAKQMLLMLVSCSAQYELKMAAYKISGIVHRNMDMLIIACNVKNLYLKTFPQISKKEKKIKYSVLQKHESHMSQHKALQ